MSDKAVMQSVLKDALQEERQNLIVCIDARKVCGGAFYLGRVHMLTQVMRIAGIITTENEKDINSWACHEFEQLRTH